MAHQFYTLDVFTTQKFSGNPLAVIMAADDLSGEEMQVITREFNLAESIFVLKPENPQHTARVRIFTPGHEMSFAGHPTVGCAVHLASLQQPVGDFEMMITLEEKAGLVPVKVKRQGKDIIAQFTAPVLPSRLALAMPAKTLLAQALNLNPDDIGFGAHNPQALEGGVRFLHVPIASRKALAKAQLIEPYWSEIVTALTNVGNVYLYTDDGTQDKNAFNARMFGPGFGIPEDPATGAATVLLAAQLLHYDKLGDGTHKWVLSQGEDMGRQSTLYLEADVKGAKLSAVRVAGSAVKVMEGQLY